MKTSAVQIHPDDNVANLLRDHVKGERPQLADRMIVALAQDVSLGHKVAVLPIASGESVVKFGAVIGYATGAIAAGEHVHLHNLEGPPF